MFFDNASTTKIDSKIMSRLTAINDELFYNPGGLYENGRKSKRFLEECRSAILERLNFDGDIVFTGSATESNNIALFGCLKKNTRKILVSMGEHPSVYNVALEIKNRGHDVGFVNLLTNGSVDFEDFKAKMTEDTDIVSIMYVNNETGAINNISELVEYAKSINPNVVFHCDGVQAVGKINVDIDELGVDLFTMSAHKIHGCKGVGALFVKNGIKLKPLIFGGGQESGIRSGTENILGIFTLSKAVEMATNKLIENHEYVSHLKDYFIDKITNSGLSIKIHSNENCSPYIVSLSLVGCRAETILNMLSDKGICIGNGSACSSKRSGNRILENMGVSKGLIEGNVRISFSKWNTEKEIDCLVENMKNAVSDYLQKVR